MRAKVAKLISRSCGVAGVHYRREKRAWNRIPRNQRHDQRTRLVEALEELKGRLKTKSKGAA